MRARDALAAPSALRRDGSAAADGPPSQPVAAKDALRRRPRLDGPDPVRLNLRNRMPYFRYFGPTAIMPGFKQMVVKVRGQRRPAFPGKPPPPPGRPARGKRPAPVDPPPDARAAAAELPVYDPADLSPSPLLTELCHDFFRYLGCIFPFLQKDRFLRDLDEKQVDAILVNAVCALAARFSQNPLLTSPDPKRRANSGARAAAAAGDDDAAVRPFEYGQEFAKRAKSGILESFPCPSVAVVQATLLLAYDEFGSNRDSGLWMYLGIAIRMAQDIGMQTLEGLRYEGRRGPDPQSWKKRLGRTPDAPARPPSSADPAVEEQRAVERERTDTFWSVYFLDGVIACGTGRSVTLRDRDIEIAFPSLGDGHPAPPPFPALIRIIHLIGRATDLINGIKRAPTSPTT